LLVVDNNSTDETPEVVQQHQKKNPVQDIQICYVKEKNQGLSHARNRGIEEANAPIIVFVDDDIRASKNYINSWIHFFEGHPDVNAAGGKIHVQFDDPRPDWMSSYLLPLLGLHDFGTSIKPYRKTDYPFGGNMAFKADIFDEYGTFNTDLGRIGSDLKASEEKELFRRLQQDDLTISYVPDALLYHRVNSSRLTKDYIRRQAIGLGQSIALQLKHASGWLIISTMMKEIGKWAATVALFVFYGLKLRLSKGVTLFQFRYWILKGLLFRNRS
jgi:glycosyltransferase involved in cell wall biosynthesis